MLASDHDVTADVTVTSHQYPRRSLRCANPPVSDSGVMLLGLNALLYGFEPSTFEYPSSFFSMKRVSLQQHHILLV